MKCIFHIGTEKTGTSTLQRWLHENRDVLSANGIALSAAAGPYNSLALTPLVTGRYHDDLRVFDVRSPEQAPAFLADLSVRLRTELDRLAETHHTLIVSAEHLHSRLTRAEDIVALRHLFESHCDDFQILCYMREQSRLRTSLYSTALRVGKTASLSSFGAQAHEGSHYYNYFNLLTMWSNVFGAEAMNVRLFDRDRFVGGDLRRDFLASLGLNIDPDALSYEVDNANTSFGRVGAAVMRQLNRNFPKFEQDATIRKWRSICVKILMDMCGTSDQPLIDPRQATFYDVFDRSNRKMANRFLAMDGNPFQRPRDYPPEAENLLPGEARQRDAHVEFMSRLMAYEDMVNLKTGEFEALRDVALNGLEGGTVATDDARHLLRIASRSRCYSPMVDDALKGLDATES